MVETVESSDHLLGINGTGSRTFCHQGISEMDMFGTCEKRCEVAVAHSQRLVPLRVQQDLQLRFELCWAKNAFDRATKQFEAHEYGA